MRWVVVTRVWVRLCVTDLAVYHLQISLRQHIDLQLCKVLIHEVRIPKLVSLKKKKKNG